ncbi:hypothetical protein BGZ63DRAFT_399350 [Mariannaea sp. PMI_226]|nr:hypothetical protein BGZ63DRAFT_399350 [Mariannaea sp. PMI_226]
MSHLHSPLGHYAGSSRTTNLTSEYNPTRPSSSGQPASPSESYNLHALSDPNPYQNSEFAQHFNPGFAMYGNSIPEENIDIGLWIGDEPTIPTGGVNSWEVVTKKKAQGIIDQFNKCLPPAQNKRTWSKHRAYDGNEEEDTTSRRRKKGPAVAEAPVYALSIAQDIRKLVDSDFEFSMEWCSFYLHEPLKFFHKPWTSCTKQRAEISHIITHMISDHGLIRGCNSKRKSQRYLTRCKSHNETKKGKSDCGTCSQVEHWAPEQLNDQRHAGPSLCLRCYAELGTKEELYQHLHEASICLYQEDLPMIQKSRILYTVFCSSTEVPKFRPPAETSAPRDGARKRNMKGTRRPATTTDPKNTPQLPTQPIAQAPHGSSGPSNAHLPPALCLSPLSSGGNLKREEDFPGNLFSPTQPTQPLQIGLAQHQTQPPQYSQTLIHRQPVPSHMSELDLELHSYYPQACQMTLGENMASLHTTTLNDQSLSAVMQPEKYPAYDSAIGSEMGGILSQPSYEEQIFPADDTFDMTMNEPSFHFNEAFVYMPGWWNENDTSMGNGQFQNWS